MELPCPGLHRDLPKGRRRRVSGYRGGFIKFLDQEISQLSESLGNNQPISPEGVVLVPGLHDMPLPFHAGGIGGSFPDNKGAPRPPAPDLGKLDALKIKDLGRLVFLRLLEKPLRRPLDAAENKPSITGAKPDEPLLSLLKTGPQLQADPVTPAVLDLQLQAGLVEPVFRKDFIRNFLRQNKLLYFPGVQFRKQRVRLDPVGQQAAQGSTRGKTPPASLFFPAKRLAGLLRTADLKGNAVGRRYGNESLRPQLFEAGRKGCPGCGPSHDDCLAIETGEDVLLQAGMLTTHLDRMLFALASFKVDGHPWSGLITPLPGILRALRHLDHLDHVGYLPENSLDPRNEAPELDRLGNIPIVFATALERDLAGARTRRGLIS